MPILTDIVPAYYVPDLLVKLGIWCVGYVAQEKLKSVILSTIPEALSRHFLASKMPNQW